MSARKIAKLRDKLQKVLAKEKFRDALALYDQLAQLEPDEPRWPHRHGDLLRRMKDDAGALIHYEAAVKKYSQLGFVARAAALGKLIISIDPSRAGILNDVRARDSAPDLSRPDVRSMLPLKPPPGGARASLPLKDPPPLRAPAPAPSRAAPPAPVPSRPAPPAPSFAAPARPAPPPSAPPPPPPTARPVAPAAPAPSAQMRSFGKPAAEASPAPNPSRRNRRERRKSFQMDAAKLIPDESVPSDEIRFMEVDDDELVEIELSDADLLPRTATRRTTLDMIQEDILLLDAEEEPDRVSPEMIAQAPSAPLFNDLPRNTLTELLLRADVVDLEGGAFLVEAGQPSDALWVLVEGQARVAVAEGFQPLVGEGDVVGESCMLTGANRGVSVVATGPVTAMRFSRQVLDELIAEHPEVRDALLELLGRRLLVNLLQTSPLFSGFDENARRALGSFFQVRSAPAGTNLLVEGHRGDGLYCLLAGQVIVEGPRGPWQLQPGGLVGEGSLLSASPSDVSARCTAESLLLRLPASKFLEVASMYPPVLESLSRLAEERRLTPIR